MYCSWIGGGFSQGMKIGLSWVSDSGGKNGISRRAF